MRSEEPHDAWVIDHFRLAGGGAGDVGRGAAAAADHAVPAVGRTVLRPLFAALSSLAAAQLWFGPYLRHWQQHRALPPGAKWKAVLVIVFTFACSLWLVKIWWVRGLLLLMLAILLTFMLRLPVIDLSQQKQR